MFKYQFCVNESSVWITVEGLLRESYRSCFVERTGIVMGRTQNRNKVGDLLEVTSYTTAGPGQTKHPLMDAPSTKHYLLYERSLVI